MAHNFEFDPDTGERVSPPKDGTEFKLIKCDDCGQMVSRRAANCIHCGAPLVISPSMEQSTAEPKVYKRAGAAREGVGFLLIVAGMLMAMASSGTAAGIGGILLASGFVIFIIGRLT